MPLKAARNWIDTSRWHHFYEIFDSVREIYLRALLHEALGDIPAAIQDCDKSIELDSKNSAAYSNRVLMRTKKDDQKGALADLNTAMKLNQADSSTYGTRAAVRGPLGDLKGAIDDCDAAVVLEPGAPWVYMQRAEARLSLGDKRGAISDYTKAISLDPHTSVPTKNGPKYTPAVATCWPLLLIRPLRSSCQS